jgi:hypothetical protein
MVALLGDLLDMSRSTRGVFALKKEYTELQGYAPVAHSGE